MAEQHSDNPKGKSKGRADKSPELVAKAFVACPRCGLFLASYRLIHDDFGEAVENSQRNWIELTWNPDTRYLIYKSYGFGVQQDTFHFEGICQDCRRAFVFRAPATRRKTETFQIQIQPS